MIYELGKTYTIDPFSYQKYAAEFVGYIQIKGENEYPVFKWDFYAFEPKTCLMALRDGKCVGLGPNQEELINNFKREIIYYGTEHHIIKHGPLELTIDEFIKQAREANVKDGDIAHSLMIGYYNTTHGDGGGEIKYCPNCKVIRKTSCSACGCGNCETCDYRWCCRPIEPTIQAIDLKTLKSFTLTPV